MDSHFYLELDGAHLEDEHFDIDVGISESQDAGMLLDLDWDEDTLLADTHEETAYADEDRRFAMDADEGPVPDTADVEADEESGEVDERPGEMDEEGEGEDDNIDPRAEPIERLENLVLSFLSQLSVALQDSDGGVAKKDRKRKIVLEIADRKKTNADGTMGTRILKFPQKTRGASVKPFAQLFRVADLMHEALLDDIPTTKRDMYYKDVSLFKSQAVVDRLVDDLAATFELGRADLHVRASPKGLVCGSGLTIHLAQDEVMSVKDSEGTLIPASEEIARFEVSDDLSWVLVVEKEAVFQTLCRLKFASHAALPGPGIVITGKGYPDVATRQLVKTLSDNLPTSIPILALVDGDAYGIDILSVYKYGSASMRHESERLAARRVRWLGIWASELAGQGIEKDALIPITKHDEKKALGLLRREGLPRSWRKELQYMLHTRRKAEIEILCAAKTGEDDMLMDEDSDGEQPALGTRSACRDPPLLRYLVNKVSAFVARYAIQA